MHHALRPLLPFGALLMGCAAAPTPSPVAPTGAATAASAAAGAPDVTGSWGTESEPIDGRGGGRIMMDAAHREGGVTFTYGDHTMVCALRGAQCSGTWQGVTGSGWFAITFAADGRSFDGTWGYGDDRAQSARFSGTR